MSLRQSLDLPRGEFVRVWCLDVDPECSEADIRRGLIALENHLPERLNELERRAMRGIAPILPLIELGLVLADCEALDGFAPVMARAYEGERSALSELSFAA